ncbi:MAG: hypothetical protein HY781_05295 [Chloroflexi bacterium]|nr:hypothetical protein [Chloroflexota bacterium]
MRASRTPWYIPAIMAAGAFLRLLHLFSISWNAPFHLGGLFYEFSLQILQNHFALPETIPYYSLDGIPFAYPPLGFYLQAVLMGLFSPPPFLTVNLLPPLLAVLSLPAFYWMVKALTDDIRLRAAALFAFALMPSAFVNHIEAAGLADACGTLAMILYLGGLFRLEKSPRLIPALLAGLFLGLCVLASPGSAYGAVIISILFFLKFLVHDLKARTFRGSAWLLLAGLTGLLISAPYWLTVVGHHGFGVFLVPFLTQHDPRFVLSQIKYILTFKPADMIIFVPEEGLYGFLFDWLVFAGLLWAALNKQGFQVLLLFTFWLIPREGNWLVAIPAAWLAASGIVHLLWPLLQKAFSMRPGHRPPLAPGVVALCLALLALASAVYAVGDLQSRADLQISAAATETLRQERDIIPAEAHVLIAGNMALQEWAPQLLERDVLNCEFGLEWQPEEFQQVRLINAALEEDDLAGAMDIVRDYSGDTSLWLVGDPEQVARLISAADPSLEISIREETPELVFALVQVKYKSP